MNSRKFREATVAVHGAEVGRDQPYGAVVSPVFHSSTYGFECFDEMRRYAHGELKDSFFYSRYANPTVVEVERKIAELEHAEDCVVTSSGSAATFCTLIALCRSGDKVVASDSIYGGSVKIMTNILSRFGIGADFVSCDQLEELPSISNDRARVFWFETPANPINRVVDLRKAAAASKKAGLMSVVDNTFATPVLQKPLESGIDVVMHSATKYLGGHSDLTAGAVAGKRDFIQQVRQISVLIGTTLDPAAAYLLNRGIKTLEVRVRATCDNALKLAQALSRHPKVSRVYYPGLEDDPGHEIASRQMSAFGGIVAIDLAGGEQEVEKLFDNFKLIRSAPSLGGVETLASYPLYSSHTGFSDEQLKRAGVSASTIRLSIGIEAWEDLLEDLHQALSHI